MATKADMAVRRTDMTGRFCLAARRPFPTASPSEEWGEKSGLKGFPAAAGLLRVWIRDAETGAGQSILVIDDRSGEVNQPAILDEKLHAVGGELFVVGLPSGDFHLVIPAGAAARFDVDA